MHNSILKQSLCVAKPNADCCVVDGGAALHQSPWVLQCTYNDLADQFIKHIVSRRDSYEIHMVFDGYSFDRSTKTNEQQQHQNTGRVAADVIITADVGTCMSVKKEEFLLNRSNKSQLIKLLRQRLTERRI